MIPANEILIRLLLGAIIGGAIGFEREIHGRAAGFRTQLIVCLAAVLIMIISENYYHYIHNADDSLRIDPARISAGALIGIGFLGGGVIVKSGFAVRGLTTAASIWIVSAIGLAIGGGLYFEALAAGIITIIALVALRILEKKILTVRYLAVQISAPVSEKTTEENIRSLLTGQGFHIHAVQYEKNHSTGELIYNFTVSTKARDSVRGLFKMLSSLEYIHNVKISK